MVEAPADYNTATGIAEKTILEYAPEWLKEAFDIQQSSLFAWTGLENSTSFSCWSDVRRIEKQFEKDGYLQGRILGHDDKPYRYDYPVGRKVLFLVVYLKNKRQRNIDAVLLIRDADSRSHAQERLESLNRVRTQFNNQTIPAVIGFAIPTREAWVLNGFEPKTKDESERLQKIRDEINIDPCKESHRLRGKKKQPGAETRDIKRILTILTNDDTLREEECWKEAPLSTLLDRGKETGLTNYIQEVQTYLLPVLIQPR